MLNSLRQQINESGVKPVLTDIISKFRKAFSGSNKESILRHAVFIFNFCSFLFAGNDTLYPQFKGRGFHLAYSFWGYSSQLASSKEQGTWLKGLAEETGSPHGRQEVERQ